MGNQRSVLFLLIKDVYQLSRGSAQDPRSRAISLCVRGWDPPEEEFWKATTKGAASSGTPVCSPTPPPASFLSHLYSSNNQTSHVASWREVLGCPSYLTGSHPGHTAPIMTHNLSSMPCSPRQLPSPGPLPGPRNVRME